MGERIEDIMCLRFFCLIDEVKKYRSFQILKKLRYFYIAMRSEEAASGRFCRFTTY